MQTNNNVWKYTVSFGLSLALCSVLNALLVTVKEKSPAVMSGMAKLTGHHWTTHSAVMLVLFLLFGFGFARMGGERVPTTSLVKTLVVGIAAGAAIIIGFYLLAD